METQPFQSILACLFPFKTSLEEWKQSIDQVTDEVEKPFKTSLEEWKLMQDAPDLGKNKLLKLP